MVQLVPPPVRIFKKPLVPKKHCFTTQGFDTETLQNAAKHRFEHGLTMFECCQLEAGVLWRVGPCQAHEA